jgi:hypothetical protein
MLERVDTDSRTKTADIYDEKRWQGELNPIFQDNSPELLECEPAIVYLHEHEISLILVGFY